MVVPLGQHRIFTLPWQSPLTDATEHSFWLTSQHCPLVYCRSQSFSASTHRALVVPPSTHTLPLGHTSTSENAPPQMVSTTTRLVVVVLRWVGGVVFLVVVVIGFVVVGAGVGAGVGFGVALVVVCSWPLGQHRMAALPGQSPALYAIEHFFWVLSQHWALLYCFVHSLAVVPFLVGNPGLGQHRIEASPSHSLEMRLAPVQAIARVSMQLPRRPNLHVGNGCVGVGLVVVPPLPVTSVTGEPGVGQQMIDGGLSCVVNTQHAHAQHRRPWLSDDTLFDASTTRKPSYSCKKRRDSKEKKNTHTRQPQPTRTETQGIFFLRCSSTAQEVYRDVWIRQAERAMHVGCRVCVQCGSAGCGAAERTPTPCSGPSLWQRRRTGSPVRQCTCPSGHRGSSILRASTACLWVCLAQGSTPHGPDRGKTPSGCLPRHNPGPGCRCRCLPVARV